MLWHFKNLICHNSKAQRLINFERAKILKEKGFTAVLPGQILCKRCVTEYKKSTKPPKNEKARETIETEFTRQISIR